MLELCGGVRAGGYDLCMVPETSVSGPDRTKNIADLQPGDHVWSWMDGELQARPVVAAWCSKDQEVSKVLTRGRTTVASGSCLFLRVVETARKTTHREAAAWAGFPPGRVPYGSRKDAACSVSGCPDRVDARGMCPRHFRRWHVHGDPRIYETTATIFGYEGHAWISSRSVICSSPSIVPPIQVRSKRFQMGRMSLETSHGCSV